MNSKISVKEIKYLVDKLFLSCDRINYIDYNLNSIPIPNCFMSIFTKLPIIGSIWRQLHRLSPFNLRPLLGMSNNSEYDIQFLIIIASAYLKMWSKYQSAIYKKYLNRVLDILLPMVVKDGVFRVTQGRRIFLKNYSASADTVSPILMVWCTNLFFEIIKQGIHTYKEFSFVKLINDSLNYFIKDHNCDEYSYGIYFNYSVNMKKKVFNASAEISSMLFEIGQYFNNIEATQKGLDGLLFIAYCQNKEGFWFYGDSYDLKYIDNFHTAYILEAFRKVSLIDKDRFKKTFETGLLYYRKRLFKDNCFPVHFDTRYIPLNSNLIQKQDLRDFCSSIILFSNIGDVATSHKLANLMISKMYSRDKNYFYSEQTLFWTNRVKYIEYQAWALYSLATLLEQIDI